MHPYSRRPKNEKGSILLTTLIFTFVLLAGTGSYIQLLQSEKRAVTSMRHELRSEALAEAGLEESLWEYRKSSGDFAEASWAIVNGNERKSVNNFTDTFGNVIGDYIITISSYNGTSPEISVTGTIDGSWDSASASTTVVAKMTTPVTPLFSQAIASNGAVTLGTNTDTNSYNSSVGKYGGVNILNNGDIVTNGTTASVISLAAGADVKGDVNMGVGGTVSAPAQVSGTKSNTFNTTFLSVDDLYKSHLTTLKNLSPQGTITESITLSGNVNYEKINLSKDSTITVTADTDLYLSSTTLAMDCNKDLNIKVNDGVTFRIFANGPIDIKKSSYISSVSNSTLRTGTQGLKTSAVQIYGTSTCTSISFKKNPIFNGAIYAPSAAIDFAKDTDIYGALLGSSVTFAKDSNMRYDENLGSVGASGDKELSWVRQTD